jgi:NADPH:quinone reductase-like Zn-dependent oxidoreductase
MRAAVLHEYGVPTFGEFETPSVGPGQAVVDVLAAGVNPVDASISAGRFYAGKPPLPSVAGREGVGILAGERVYFDEPIPPFGSMAKRALIDPRSTYSVPDGVEDGMAVALGISGLAAWLPLTWRAELKPGEHVLVLAASGVLGQIAVQAAKLLGAGRVVAPGDHGSLQRRGARGGQARGLPAARRGDRGRGDPDWGRSAPARAGGRGVAAPAGGLAPQDRARPLVAASTRRHQGSP